MEKQKKPIYKKWWFWVLAVIIVGGIGGASKDKKAADTSTKKVAAENKYEAKKEEKKEDVKKETFDFSKAELSKENIIKALDPVLDKAKIKNIEITTKDNKNIIDITYNPGEVISEKYLVQGTAINATNAMEILFKNSKVDKVWFWTETEMVDQKGNKKMDNVVNVALTKENAKDINWSEFKTMVKGDYKKLFNIADSKFIHPSISKKLN